MSIVPDRLAKTTRGGVAPIARRLHALGVSANAVTLVGFLITVAGAVLLAAGHPAAALFVLLLGALSDTLDGQIARAAGGGTRFGAFLDSTLDRIEEGVVLTAVAAYFASRGDDFAVAAVVLVVLGSLMVSYTRARAEALGVECKVGLATRPVRVVLLSAGLVFAKGAGIGDFELLAPAIYVMAALTALTVWQRVWHVRRSLASRAEI